MKTPLLIFVFFLLILPGCAMKKHGNFLEDINDNASEVLATDSARIIQGVYPPASTKLLLGKDAPKVGSPKKDSGQKDLYGVLLVSKLREAGYATSDTYLTSYKLQDALKAARLSDSVLLVYDVDNLDLGDGPKADMIEQAKQYVRVTLRMGYETLNRAYEVYGSRVLPMGFWTRGAWVKEEN